MDKQIAELTDWLKKQTKQTMAIIIILLVIFVFVLDYVTGPYISTSIFYLLPIAFAAWGMNKRFALFISIVCAVVWLLTDISTNPISTAALTLIPFWNAVVRLGFFVIVTIALATLHEAKKRQEEMMPFIVHDLRSPLSNILMSLTFVRDEKLLDPIVGGLLDSSIVSSQKMLIQVNSLLDLSQLENKKLQVIASDVEVSSLLHMAIGQVSFLAAQKQIEITTDVAEDNLFAWADESLTVRVLVNLLSNSIKFSPVNSTIAIKICLNNEVLNFCIRDQGPGIPVEWQKQVFNKYEQVQTGKSSLPVGSGLGLAFCKAAVEAQNGRIWLESPDNGAGTIICFTLPPSPLHKAMK